MSFLEERLETIKDAYYKLETMDTRQAESAKEISNLVIQIAAIMEVTARDEIIYPDYALEKLIFLLERVQAHIRYWEVAGDQMLQEALEKKGNK